MLPALLIAACLLTPPDPDGHAPPACYPATAEECAARRAELAATEISGRWVCETAPPVAGGV